MMEESYLGMLRLGDEVGESCIFASPSPITSSSSPSSCCYSSATVEAARSLYFGGKEEEEEELQLPHFKEIFPIRRRSISSSSMSSSPSSTITSSKTIKKNTGGRRSSNASTMMESTVNTIKKYKTVSGGITKVRKERIVDRIVALQQMVSPYGKVRKERIGDRIVALQQMVSPYGKSDTASVLHEALGYIRFLHDQVQVLSSPYLHQRLPSSAPCEEEREKDDLRSRGLCLVPVSCTESMSDCNGADLWSTVAMGTRNIFPSSSYKD